MGLLRVWGCSLFDEIVDGLADALHNIFEGIVMCGPPGDRFAICRQNLEFVEGRSLPVGGAQDNRQDTCLVGIMPCDRLRHFDPVIEIGGHEVSADHKHNNLIGVEVFVDLWLPFAPWTDIPIIPGSNDVLSPEVAQVIFQFLAECSIAMRIGDEDGKRHTILLSWCSIFLKALYPEMQKLSLRV